ncbi:MAG: DUF1080 domain-containing protein [Cyclobacteriaceae bacterium]
MKLQIILLTALVIGTMTSASAQKMKPAFNGKNLKGWAVPENNIWWTVNDGMLSAKSGPDKKGSILWTAKDYEDFVIEADFKYGDGTVDSGIFLRTEKQQIQMGISGSLKRDMTCSPYIPGKGYPVEASNIKKLLKTKDWNTIKVKAEKNIYTVWLNGEQVLKYESEDAIDKGPIGLQLHPKREMNIDFKNISIGVI